MNRAGTADAGAWFARRYGREPEGTWFAPGRVNLIGGPDYTEVFVLPFALGTGAFAAARRIAEPRPTVSSLKERGGTAEERSRWPAGRAAAARARHEETGRRA